jgi:TPR repeat protein
MGDIAAGMPATRDKAANQQMLRTAIGWYENAAAAGVASAQFKLANAYLAGVGVTRSPQQAQQWYARAAAQGMPEAQYGLGLFLVGGVGGTTDLVDGYKWLVIAGRRALKGGREARRRRPQARRGARGHVRRPAGAAAGRSAAATRPASVL